jgi:hypothetical protein
MKASLFCTARHMGAAHHDIWPLSGEYYSGGAAVRSMQTTFDQFRRAGFRHLQRLATNQAARRREGENGLGR